MPLYEHVYLARPDITTQQVEAITEEMTSFLTESGGEVPKAEYWGLRNLAYRVKKNRKAHYALLNISANAETVHELERRMRLHEDVLRYMTVRVDEHDEGQSAILSKKEERKRPRGPRPDGER